MNAPTPRRQSKAEAAISDEMMAFQHEFVGRGPERIRTRIVEDLVIVRSFGVFTSAENNSPTATKAAGSSRRCDSRSSRPDARSLKL
jgi:uncharacterized protein YbcI